MTNHWVIERKTSQSEVTVKRVQGKRISGGYYTNVRYFEYHSDILIILLKNVE